MEVQSKISSSPHIRDDETSGSIMLDVIIALLPASIFGVYNFGFKAFLTILISIISCVVFEFLYEYILKKKITVNDYSAVLTGLLLALNLPPDVPFWIPIIGGAFAIIIVKQLFGGIGQNFMNPALAARCFLLISFADIMTKFSYDAVTGATPLAILKSGGEIDVIRMFLGSTAGTIGETSAIALIIGGLYLIVVKVVNFRIPVFYIGTFALCITIYALCTGKGLDPQFILGHLFGGGLMLGAFFMATDYVTSPITNKGKIVFGILIGIITFLIRVFGPGSEGVSYAIIIGNLLVPLIERWTVPKSFGKGAEVHE